MNSLKNKLRGNKGFLTYSKGGKNIAPKVIKTAREDIQTAVADKVCRPVYYKLIDKVQRTKG